MAGVVASHLMNSVVDSVEVESLGALSQIELPAARAVLSVNTHLKVLLGGVGYDLAEQLSKLCSVLSLLVSSLLPVQTDFRVAFAVSDAGHCQIHTDLGALALEMLAQISHDVLGAPVQRLQRAQLPKSFRQPAP